MKYFASFVLLMLGLSSGITAQSVTCFDARVALGTNCTATPIASSFTNNANAVLELKMNGVTIPGNILNASHVGKIITAHLSAPDMTPCWAYIEVEDKQPPVINCPADIVIACTQDPSSLTVTGTATATACSGIASLTNFDQVQNLACTTTGDGALYSQIIERTFVAVSNNGMTTRCTQTIRIARADINDVIFPADYTESCAVSTSTLPTVTGYPTITIAGTTMNIVPGQLPGSCMLQSTMTDVEVQSCGTDRYIKRSWMVLIMCQTGGTQNVMRMGEQVIKITSPGPIIDPIGAITLSADLGQAPAHGGCSTTESLPSATATGQCDGHKVPDDNISIAILNSTGTTVVGGTTNGGSANNLPLGTYIARYEAIDTCGRVSMLDVALSVVDSYAPQCVTVSNYFIQLVNNQAQVQASLFDAGSSDNCSANVYVQARKLTADCSATANVFGDIVEFCCADLPNGVADTVMVQLLVCDKDPDDAANYTGGAIVKSATGVPDATLFTGNCESTCMASAILKPSAENNSIVCPADTTISCAAYADSISYGTANVANPCGSTIFTFMFTDSGVFNCAMTSNVITRTHYMLNGTTRVDSCTQTITVTGGLEIATPKDTVISCEDYTTTNLPPVNLTGKPTYTGGACLGGTISIRLITPESVVDQGDSLIISRRWVVDGAPTSCSFDTIRQTITTEANCCKDTNVELVLAQNGSQARFIDNIGNVLTSTNDFTFRWFNGTSDAPGTQVEMDDVQPITTVTTQFYHLVLIQDSNAACTDTIDFRAPNDNQRVIGFVSTPSGAPVANVQVALEANLEASAAGKDEIMETALTSIDGIYEFEAVAIDQVNKLSLSRDGDDRTNVSTLDLLRLARHILGIKQITSPYGYIAADVTGNGKISTGDMLLLQRIILGITEDLPDNTSWRFVQEDHVFDDMSKVLDYSFPESFEFSGEETEEDLQNINFIGIKIGDLDDAYGINLQGGNSTNKTLSLQTDDMTLLPGALIEVPITAASLTNLYGYQHAYQFDSDKIVFTGIKYGDELALNDDNFGFKQLSAGQLTTSWFDTEAHDIDDATVLYTLRFEVRSAAQLSEVLSISSQSTSAEAYFEDDQVGGIQLSFAAPTADQLTIVNTPNPFKEETQVRFDAPAKGEAVISITDISGREVYRTAFTAVQGENQRTVSKEDLKETGIYILKINLNGSSATQKMIMIE